MKQQPPGFSINYDRYKGAWRWRQTVGVDASKKASHVVERAGFRSRNAALQDLCAEIERRKSTPSSTPSSAPDQAAAT